MRPRKVVAKTKLVDPIELLDKTPTPLVAENNCFDLAAENIERKYFEMRSGGVILFKPSDDELLLLNYLMKTLRVGKMDVLRRALVELYKSTRKHELKQDVLLKQAGLEDARKV